MPVYEYQCENCGQVSEFLVQGINIKLEIVCSACGSYNLTRQISVPILLKKAPNQAQTCCGRTERCQSPPCSTGGQCHKQ
jgi:putative FmdB family regulatory protein